MAMKARYTTVDGEILAEQRSGTRRTFVPDGVGSTLALLNSTPTKTDTWGYWPYGEIASRTGTTPTPFQFVGSRGYYSDNSSLTYVRARHFDPVVARWMQRDPIGTTPTSYQYVDGRPTLLADPTGLVPAPPGMPPLGDQRTDEEREADRIRAYMKKIWDEFVKKGQTSSPSPPSRNPNIDITGKPNPGWPLDKSSLDYRLRMQFYLDRERRARLEVDVKGRVPISGPWQPPSVEVGISGGNNDLRYRCYVRWERLNGGSPLTGFCGISATW